VARKGSGYLPPASVSFGLSSPAAKWPERVRLDKGGKVTEGRWQDISVQSLGDVSELLLQRLGGQQAPPTALSATPPW
jgi:hypothetical protein